MSPVKMARGNKLFVIPGPLAQRGKGGSPADGKKFVAERNYEIMFSWWVRRTTEKSGFKTMQTASILAGPSHLLNAV